MPELPEVETVRRFLSGKIAGKRITGVRTDLPRLVRNTSPDEFAAALVGREIIALERKGKYLRMRLSGPRDLLIHLRMTGRLIYADEAAPEPPYTRIACRLSEGALFYGDVRTLGCLWIIPSDGASGISGYDSLGPDALGSGFSGEWLFSVLSKTKKPVKAVLLDQTAVAGIGNIYADEALFLARVAPARPANRVTREEAETLRDAVVRVMERSLAAGGTTFRDFLDGEGKVGGNAANLAVYGRDGLPCPVCGATILLTRTASRGTRFCPVCQK